MTPGSQSLLDRLRHHALFQREPFQRYMLPGCVWWSRRLLRGRSGPRILDVGCGSRVPQYFSSAIPDSFYIGVDCAADHLPYGPRDDRSRFILADLDSTRLDDIEDRSFDLVVASHVLEHLRRGTNALDFLCPKLRPGGFLYVATPVPESVAFPHKAGTLNFFDDPTHVKVISASDLREAAVRNGMSILGSGVTRRYLRLATMPLLLTLATFLDGEPGPALWDLYGFEHYLVGQRKEGDPASSFATRQEVVGRQIGD
jgi:SAM-dependent methyltransferase